jgi:uncharacterized repeat protein (TIGR03899 family)
MSDLFSFNGVSEISKPVTKLIETISSAVGVIYEPTRIRKKAKAEADGAIIIAKANAKVLNIESRAKLRVESLERSRQENIEAVVKIAHDQLPEEVSNQKVDPDWTVRFFQHCQDVSNDEMQLIWGKILAGEVEKPKTFSLRTLDLVKNLDKEEAQLFSRVGQLGIIKNNSGFIFYQGGYKTLEEKYHVLFSEILKLQELNLLSTNDNIVFQLIQMEINTREIFFYGKKCIILERNANSPTLSFPILGFSTIGSELLKMIDINNNDLYMESFCKILLSEGTKVKTADYIPAVEGSIEISNVKEINP